MEKKKMIFVNEIPKMALVKTDDPNELFWNHVFIPQRERPYKLSVISREKLICEDQENIEYYEGYVRILYHCDLERLKANVNVLKRHEGGDNVAFLPFYVKRNGVYEAYLLCYMKTQELIDEISKKQGLTTMEALPDADTFYVNPYPIEGREGLIRKNEIFVWNNIVETEESNDTH